MGLLHFCFALAIFNLLLFWCKPLHHSVPYWHIFSQNIGIILTTITQTSGYHTVIIISYYCLIIEQGRETIVKYIYIIHTYHINI